MVEESGIVPRIVDAVFRHIRGSEKYHISVSMVEIYDEKIIDLLGDSGRQYLKLREHKKGSVSVRKSLDHLDMLIYNDFFCISLL